MNGVCFTLSGESLCRRGQRLLGEVELTTGEVFLTPTNLYGTPAIRISISNWRTEEGDGERVWSAMQRALKPERIET